MQTQAIWLFDGVCVLCSRGVQYTLKHEKTDSIRFVAIQSDEGRALAQTHGIDPDNPDTFLFIEEALVLQKSDAVIALARHLTGPARIAAGLSWVPRFLRDAAYSLVAHNRYKAFGKSETCIVPHADHRHRFTL